MLGNTLLDFAMVENPGLPLEFQRFVYFTFSDMSTSGLLL